MIKNWNKHKNQYDFVLNKKIGGVNFSVFLLYTSLKNELIKISKRKIKNNEEWKNDLKTSKSMFEYQS